VLATARIERPKQARDFALGVSKGCSGTIEFD
jgi:hypothetical protein